jgi:hypothetical protein
MKRNPRGPKLRGIRRILADSHARFLLGPAGRLLERVEATLTVGRVGKAEALLEWIPTLRRRGAGLKHWGRDAVDHGLDRVERALRRWLRDRPRRRVLRIRGPEAVIGLAVMAQNGMSKLAGRR